MQLRWFGRTGIRVSPLAVGTMMFGRRTAEREAHAIIDEALAAGINVIDTADTYNAGLSEDIVGRALARNGKRDSVILATKFGISVGDAAANDHGQSRRHIVRACEASLRRLGVDHVDLYQVHRRDADVALDETLGALDDLVRSGKVRYVGTSTFPAWAVVEALWASHEHRLARFVSEQPPYNILDRRIERELVPMAQTFSLALMCWSPVASGILSGAYERGGVAPGTRLAEVQRARRRLSDPVFAVVDALRPMADAKGATLTQLAVAWCINQPGVTTAIIGPETREQLAEYLAAPSMEITSDDRAAIDSLVAPGTHVADYCDEPADRFPRHFAPTAHRW